MTRGRIAGLLILCVGAFVLVRGARTSSRVDATTGTETRVPASRPWVFPPWIGGLAMVVGIALSVVGTPSRKRSG